MLKVKTVGPQPPHQRMVEKRAGLGISGQFSLGRETLTLTDIATHTLALWAGSLMSEGPLDLSAEGKGARLESGTLTSTSPSKKGGAVVPWIWNPL